MQITSFDVGNPAGNVIPAQARATINIRFNDRHSSASLEAWLRAALAQHGERFDLEVSGTCESFRTEPGIWTEALSRAIEAVSGLAPRADTGGGTSDARFFAPLCPVAEFGLVGTTMHQIDERVPVDELRRLADIYEGVLRALLR